MTLRQDYIRMRNSSKYDLNWFFKYFKEKGGTIGANEFSMLFQQFANLDEVIEHVDREYSLNRLHDKDNKFIKVVE